MRLKSIGHGAVGMKDTQPAVLSQGIPGPGLQIRGLVSSGSPAGSPRAALPSACLQGCPPLHQQVLVVVPFREAALRVVQLFISLLEGDSKKKIIVSNKKRFNGEYGSDPEERPPNLKRPEDYEAVFVGNIDDHFRIGNCPLSRLRPRGTGV